MKIPIPHELPSLLLLLQTLYHTLPCPLNWAESTGGPRSPLSWVWIPPCARRVLKSTRFRCTVPLDLSEVQRYLKGLPVRHRVSRCSSHSRFLSSSRHWYPQCWCYIWNLSNFLHLFSSICYSLTSCCCCFVLNFLLFLFFLSSIFSFAMFAFLHWLCFVLTLLC